MGFKVWQTAHTRKGRGGGARKEPKKPKETKQNVSLSCSNLIFGPEPREQENHREAQPNPRISACVWQLKQTSYSRLACMWSAVRPLFLSSPRGRSGKTESKSQSYSKHAQRADRQDIYVQTTCGRRQDNARHIVQMGTYWRQTTKHKKGGGRHTSYNGKFLGCSLRIHNLDKSLRPPFTHLILEGRGNKTKESQAIRTISVGRKSLGNRPDWGCNRNQQPLANLANISTRKGKKTKKLKETKQNFSLSCSNLIFGPRAKRSSQIRGSVRWQLK